MDTYTGPKGTQFIFNGDLSGDLIIHPPGGTDEQSSVTIPAADVIDFLLQKLVIRRTVNFLDDPDLIGGGTHERRDFWSRMEVHAIIEIGAPRKPPDGH
jgi:hypothetical protein